MVAAETNLNIECFACGAKFTLTYDKDQVDDEKPEYCPFCCDLYEDAYIDIEEDDDEDEWDEDDEW